MPYQIKSLNYIIVFSDACGGQNHNNTSTRLLMGFTVTDRFNSICPVKGPSFLPCDRNFAVINRQVRRNDQVYLPKNYDDMIAQARKTGEPFKGYSVKNMKLLTLSGLNI